MLLVNGMYKSSELDDYEQGIIGDYNSHFIDYSFNAKTIEELINKLIEFTGHDDICLNACDEPGRVDIQGMEDSHGCVATESDMEEWKIGFRKLYAVTYTCYVLECKPYIIKDGHETYIKEGMK